MTTYEISQTEKAIATFDTILQEAISIRANAEQQLIEVARRPWNSRDTSYFEALRNTISEQTRMIPIYENQIIAYKQKLQ